MKLVITIFSVLLVLLLISACQNEVALSQHSKNSQQNNKVEVSNKTTITQIPIPEKEDGFYIDEIVSEKKYLIYKGYKIRQFLTKKKYDDAPIADIADAVLEKNGKQLLQFDGSYYPLGNQMQFGLYSLLKNKNKEMLVYENTNRFGRCWVVSFDNEAKLIFDSKDWDSFREWVSFKDFENDGIYEISMARYDHAGFTSLASIDMPLVSIIFKYDEKVGKYLPANHKYQETAKKLMHSGNNLGFREVMENFLAYIYAGMEKEAWEYFEKKYNFGENSPYSSNFNEANEKTSYPPDSKSKARERIQKSLQSNKIYQFIKKDLEKNN